MDLGETIAAIGAFLMITIVVAGTFLLAASPLILIGWIVWTVSR